MIHVERGPAPKDYKRRADAENKNLLALTKSGKWRYSQQKLPFNRRLHSAAKPHLYRLFHGKCAYCESIIGPIDPGDVDTFRPKTLYPWLTYDWTNLLLSCRACNVAKATRFPLQDEKLRAERPQDVRREQPLLLDPCSNEPEQHLVFDVEGKVYSDTPQGQTTIDTLTLNRSELVRARKLIANQVQHQIRLIQRDHSGNVAGLGAFIGDDAQYAGMARQLVKRASEKKRLSIDLDSLKGPVSPRLRKRFSETKSKSVRRARTEFSKHEQRVEAFSLSKAQGPRVSKRYFAKRRIIERVKVENFRVLKKLDISLASDSESPSSFMMILGENATGKSSLLKAIALTMMSREERRAICTENRITPNDVLSHGASEGSVQVWLSGVKEPLELRFRRNARNFTGAPADKVFVFGYGATRLFPRPGMAAPRSRGPVRCRNLFSPIATLVDAERTLSALSKKQFGPAARVLKSLLPIRSRDRLRVVAGSTGKQVELMAHSHKVSLTKLSDGYQSIVALATDILSVLIKVWDVIVDHAEAIVLIDELDAHLHPTWRKSIVTKLRTCFPNVQFIATSHDPLCLRGLKQGEVAVLRRGARSRIVAVKDLPSPEGMTSDQLLTSEHFGLDSAIDESTATVFQEYYRYLAKPKRNKMDAVRLTELTRRLRSLHYLGRTRREQIMLEVIDRFLAKMPPAEVTAQTLERREMEADLEAVYRDGRRPRGRHARATS